MPDKIYAYEDEALTRRVEYTRSDLTAKVCKWQERGAGMSRLFFRGCDDETMRIKETYCPNCGGKIEVVP